MKLKLEVMAKGAFLAGLGVRKLGSDHGDSGQALK